MRLELTLTRRRESILTGGAGIGIEEDEDGSGIEADEDGSCIEEEEEAIDVGRDGIRGEEDRKAQGLEVMARLGKTRSQTKRKIKELSVVLSPARKRRRRMDMDED